ncbi:hypothetical protein Leryth_008225 [Lithospermum erythrorhizon]|nr:hypothetical protein Leryth_008225 [Lithospermum erythrorhizon]
MDMEEIFQELLLSVGISVAVCCMIMKLKPYGDEERVEAFKKIYDGNEKAGFSGQKSKYDHVVSEIIEDVSVLDVDGCTKKLSIHEIEECSENSIDENPLRLDHHGIQDEYERSGDEKTEKSNFGEIEEGLYEDDQLSQAKFEEISEILSIEDDEHRGEGEEEEEGLFDDWEGVERTELEKVFGTAVVFVGSKSSAGLIDRDMKIKLYGLHKIAIEGPCRGAQPMSLNVSARAKWDSWKRLGNMRRELAMEQYLFILSERVPGWMRSNIPVTESRF